MKRSQFESAVSFYGTFAVVLLVIAALAVIDTMLARVDREENEQVAENYFEAGQTAVAAADFDEAIANFRTAFSMQRENLSYQLALAQSLLSAGRVEEARAETERLLDADPTNADAALIEGRLLREEGRIEEAKSFYHRAIFGRWESNEAERELSTRLELADLLAETGASEELLAELLPLRNEAARTQATDDGELKHRIAPLYLMAGSPELAAELFQELLAEQPEDPAALAGLGEAEFARANYQNARARFAEALLHDSESQEIRNRLALTDRVLELDPMARRLTSRQRYERSMLLLRASRDSLSACVGQDPDLLAFSLLDRAAEALERVVTVEQRNDAVDQNLDLAEQMWSLRGLACGPPTDPAEQPIDLVLTRMGQ